ncbi:MAG: hypothetical protein AAF242_00015 [Bacteroidota bacterium]
MNRADFITAGAGFPLESDSTLDFMQRTYTDAINGLALIAGGNNVIVSGMAITGNTVSSGWIYYNSELIRFQGGVIQPTFIIEETIVKKENRGGTEYDRYFTRVAKFGTGSGAIDYSTLQRVSDLKILQNQFINVFGKTSVVTGCEVSNVNANDLDISAGRVYVNGSLFDVEAFSGNFPVYINDQGQYTNDEPVGEFIKFDPYTSSTYALRIGRQMVPKGEIKMVAVEADRFLPSGLGRWEYEGYAICNGSNGTIDLRGRTVFGYDPRTTNPGNNIWDSNYNGLGNTGGEKEITLTESQMPVHNHTGGTPGDPVDKTSHGLARRSNDGESLTNGSADSGNSGEEITVRGPLSTPVHLPNSGGGEAHENRPPFVVLLYIQRI